MISALLLTSFLILGTAFGVLAYQFNLSDKREALNANAEAVRNLAASPIITRSQLQSSIELISEISGSHIVICSASGVVTASSDAAALTNDLWVGEEALRPTLLKGEYFGIGTLGGLYMHRYASVGLPLVSVMGNTIGAVFVSTPLQNLQQFIVQFIRIFVFSAAAVLLFSCVWAYLYARRLAKPLRRMTVASREFARGNFSARVDEALPDLEMHELAVSFNNMARDLQETEQRRREFIASISHELKTPMTSIGGYVDGLLDDVVPEEKKLPYLRVVSSEIKRLSRLVTQMLEISRMESDADGEFRKQSFDLCEMTRQVVLGQEKKFTDKKLDVDIRFDLPVVVAGDPDGITRVIYNLVDNAVKYSFEETVIVLDIEKQADKALFSITDTGNPVSPEELDRIFERFHKTDRSRKSDGLGLGLYLVHNIIGKHGEDVWCESEAGVTTMKFTLSLAKPKIGDLKD